VSWPSTGLSHRFQLRLSTPDSILLGFGFEGISTQASRNAVMGRVLDHLLD
jgi:hypothetical protein